MHFEILENFLNVATVFGGLDGVENDSERDAPVIGIKESSARDAIRASDGHACDAFVILYREASADHAVGQFDGFLDADADGVSFNVSEKPGLPAEHRVD